MRCPYCGADRLISITKNEGYSYKKGIVGAALLGPAGAVAGLDGKEKDIYHCPLCGEDTIKAMPTDESMDIFNAILKNDIPKLRRYKTKYRNIEWNENISGSTERHTETQSDRDSLQKGRSEIKSTGNVTSDIKTYFRKVDAPVEFIEILNDMKSLGYRQEDIKEAVLFLIENGVIKYRDGYFALVRDIDEMGTLKEKGLTNKALVEADLNQAENEGILKYVSGYLAFLEDEIKKYNSFIEPNIESHNQLQERITEMLKTREAKCAEMKRGLEEKEATLKKQIRDIEKRKAVLVDQINEKAGEISKLSFLQMKRKKVLQSEVDSIKDEIKALEGELSSIMLALEKNDNDLQSVETEYENSINKLIQEDEENNAIVDEYTKRIKAREREIEDIRKGNHSYERFSAYMEATKESESVTDQELMKMREDKLFDFLVYDCNNQFVTIGELWRRIHDSGDKNMQLQIMNYQPLTLVLNRLIREESVIKEKRGDKWHFRAS